jgi:hypothetical protein
MAQPAGQSAMETESMGSPASPSNEDSAPPRLMITKMVSLNSVPRETVKTVAMIMICSHSTVGT